MNLGCTIKSPRGSVPPCSGNIPRPQPQTFKVTPSAGNVVFTMFWFCQGVLLTEFQQHVHTVKSASYCTILTKLRAPIRRKRPGLLTKGMLLLHENARPHSANQTTAMLRSFKWQVLQHPPYSPDLAPSDFHLFGPLKQHLSVERFPLTMMRLKEQCARGSDSKHKNLKPQVSRDL